MSIHDKQYEIAGNQVIVHRHDKGDFEAYFETSGFISSKHIEQETATTKDALKNLLKSIESEIETLKQMQEEIEWVIK